MKVMLGKTARAALVASVAAVGAVINGAYGLHLLAQFADAGVDPAAREILISGIALELAWAFLLLWVVRHPFRGRFVLPFTGAAVLLGNGLHSYAMVHFSGADLRVGVINLVVGLVIASLFALAYRLGGTTKEMVGP